MAYNNSPSTRHSGAPLEHIPQGPKIHKTFLQWKRDAEATTTDQQQNGFPSPFAWVYVEGLDIPPNAIIGGVDRNGPWYIARTFYEGSLELGRAGRHFKLGASISYHGRDRDVGAYEVLVEANSPTRWVYQTPPTPPQLTISDIKLVVIIDDSASMEGPLWSEARDALAGAAELSRQKGGEGLDIYCLNGLQHRLDFRGESEVHEFFDSIVPEGQTPIGARLRQILEIYVPRIEDPALHHKPVSILVITDGVPTDEPQPVIIEFARYLDRKNVPLHRLGIQFVQIGDDPDATEALKELDEQLGPVHGIRDMVSTTPFSSTAPSLRGDLVIEIVLEEVNSSLGNRAQVAGQLSSPRSPGSPAQIGASGSLVQRSFKTFSQWKSEAQITTADYQQNGFPSPVAWVYIEGPALPPNAIIGGVDRNRPWHIARTFYEGSISEFGVFIIDMWSF
ncbi:hypothetical protein BC826DRAFT_402822 [Russula brevipes]|nr:hypothetical protein BC826DRAFT_402822 [Russula brevipes]